MNKHLALSLLTAGFLVLSSGCGEPQQTFSDDERKAADQKVFQEEAAREKNSSKSK